MMVAQPYKWVYLKAIELHILNGWYVNNAISIIILTSININGQTGENCYPSKGEIAITWNWIIENRKEDISNNWRFSCLLKFSKID